MVRKADQLEQAHTQGRHTPNGFPHYSSITFMCMCLDRCCHRENGCICKGCLCRNGEFSGLDHSIIRDILRMRLVNAV